MNPLAILGLLSSLYEQIAQLQQENTSLRQALAQTAEEARVEPSEPQPSQSHPPASVGSL